MTEALVIPMMPHRVEPYIFVGLANSNSNVIELVCSEHDWHWLVGTGADWSTMAEEMAAHVAGHT